MKDKLATQYELVLENQKTGTVDAKELNAPGQGMIDDGEKDAPGMGVDSPAAKSVGKPNEASAEINPGHGTIAEEKEIDEMLHVSKFDKLFSATLTEDSFGASDENPLEVSGDDEFDDDKGDFPPEGDEVGEDVDVATELRMIIDRLTEVAERLGSFDDDGEEGMDEEGLEDDMLMDPESGEAPVPESNQSDGQLRPFKDTRAKMQAKGSMRVKHNAVTAKATAHGKANTGKLPKGGGQLSKFKDSTSKMQSKGNMKVPSKTSKIGGSLFD
jgi:hypothetical protein